MKRLLIVLFYSVFFVLGTYSAPLSVNTGSDPFIVRTKWDILQTCLVTLVLCAWASIHPNIPAPTDTRLSVFCRRIKIMMTALWAPEVMVFFAMRQFFGARKIANMFKDYEWTSTHGHFAQMGGFILYEDNKPLRTLLPEELAQLSRSNRIEFPRISNLEIGDRGKFDSLSKGLVIIQISWFVAQCIARRIAGLVITQIELFTLSVVLLNASVYFFWWKKPLDIRSAIPVHLKPAWDSFHPVQETQDKEEDDLVSLIPIHNRDHSVSGRGVSEEDLDLEFTVILPPRCRSKSTDDLSPLRGTEVKSENVDTFAVLPTFYAVSLKNNHLTIMIMLSCGIAIITNALNFINVHLPSGAASQTLWNVTTIFIVGCQACLFIFLLVQFFRKGTTPFIAITRSIEQGKKRLILPFIFLHGLLFAAAVLLINNIPGEALQTLNWIEHIPHM